MQHGLGFGVVFITLLGGEEAETFTRSVVELLGDARAVALSDVNHALTLWSVLTNQSVGALGSVVGRDGVSVTRG